MTPQVKAEPSRRPVLSDDKKRLMTEVLIRNPTVFETFKDTLKVTDFSTFDAIYATAWSIALGFHEKHGKLPDRSLMLAGLSKRLQDDPNFLTEEYGDLEELIESAFSVKVGGEDISTSTVHAEWATKAVKDYLDEQLARQVQGKISNVRDVCGFLEAARRQADEIAAIDAGAGAVLFPEGWDKEGGIDAFSTGVPFFDNFLAGGHAPGEVYGLLGPFGSCKTTLAVMLAVEAAKQAHGLLSAGGDHEYVFLASYEAGVKELQLRMLSYAAQICRKSLEKMGSEGMHALSTCKNLLPYEKEMFKIAISEGKKVLGERGRAKRAIKWLKQHLVVLDMTGGDLVHRSAGSGYVGEIARRIASHLRRLGKNVKARLVLIDYVGAMARRHLETASKDEKNLRHLITRRSLGCEEPDHRQVQLPGLDAAPALRPSEPEGVGS